MAFVFHKTTLSSFYPSAVFRSQYFILLIICTLLSACRYPSADTREKRVVTDELGRKVRVVANPQRIVSLAPSVTETLFALGLGDKIVGVTAYCDHPPEAKTKEQIGDTLKPSIEKIIALKPDLVIASIASQLESFVQKLDDAGIAVYVSSPRNLAETITSIQILGDLTGATGKASELTDNLRQRIEQVQKRAAGPEKPSVFVMLGSEPLITIGGASFINDLITQAGGQSISADEKSDYPQYSLETVIARKPQVIFLQAADERLPERLQQTPAAQQGRVYHLNDDLLLRPGPRIVDGLEQIAEKLHPSP